MNTVVLVFALLGYSGLGIHIESFVNEKECQDYAREAGWLMVRSILELNSSPDPVPGLSLQCVHRT